jgi:sortase A
MHRATGRNNLLPRVDRTLWRLELALTLVAGLALGWYAGVQAAISTEQSALGRELERQAAAARVASSIDRPRHVIAPRGVVGRLEVPRLGLSAVAREGVDARTLRSAVGHVPETALPGESGNAAFAGHRDTFFRNLKDVRAGDRVLVTTADGTTEYVVQNTRIVRPSDVSVLAPTREAVLTLVTCYPFDFIGSAPQRFVVRAVAREQGS